MDACDNLVGREMQTHDAVVYVELRQWGTPQAARAGNFDFGTEAQQRWRGVTGKGRPANLSAGRYVAQIAIFLQAEAATLSPQQRLVIPQAARVEAEIAADGSHVAQHRRGNCTRRFIKHGVVFAEDRRVLDGAEGG